jgi:P27 family predicted phage terminase small subunit
MGRRPTPTPILKLRGSLRQDRHGGRPSPEILAHKRPPCPKRFILKGKTDDADFVRIEARKAWDRLCGPLFEAGLLVDTFYMTFEMLCDSWGLYRLACQKCCDEGLTTTGAKNNEVKSPWARIRTEALDEVIKLAGCYGLTPADIASVKALDKPQLDNVKAKFFGHNGGA